MALTETAPALGVTIADELLRLKRDWLQTPHRRSLNVLSGDITDSATTLTVDDVTGNPPAAGSILEIDDELLWVRDANGAQVTVLRGFDSTAAAHSDGALIEYDPRHTNVGLIAHMRSEVRSWPRSLFAVASGDFSVDAATAAVDLDGAAATWEHVRLLGVWRAPFQGVDVEPIDWRESWPRIAGVRLEPKQDTDDFPSGWALVLPREFGDAATLRVVVGHSFPTGTWTRATDLGSGVGLTSDLLEILELGAAWRATVAREQERTDVVASGSSRRADEVREGTIMQTGLRLRQLRDIALREAVKRQAANWGWGESTW